MEGDVERDTQDRGADILNQESAHEDMGNVKAAFGNPGVMNRDIISLKEQMQTIKREFEQLSQSTRGELTLSQHLDKLSEVIGNAEEVKNLMMKVPPLESKNGEMDQLMKDMLKKMDVMENRIGGNENDIKKLADQSYSTLKTASENIKNLVDRLEQGKTQSSMDLKEDQGTRKRTRAFSKKNEVEDKDMDELRASVVNINILANQAANLLKTL